jgi:hypothetical protein
MDPHPSIDDPTFGVIEFSDCSWGNKHLRLPGMPERPVFVTIPGDATGPSDQGRQLFADVIARLPQLNAQVESELARDYALLRDDKLNRGKRFPVVKSPTDVWQIARLSGIWLVQPPGAPAGDFELHYTMAWDDDHEFVAVFKDFLLTHLEKVG